jgi:hypothetical protein
VPVTLGPRTDTFERLNVVAQPLVERVWLELDMTAGQRIAGQLAQRVSR